MHINIFGNTGAEEGEEDSFSILGNTVFCIENHSQTHQGWGMRTYASCISRLSITLSVIRVGL